MIDEKLKELEKAYSYYHKSHDASAGTARKQALTAIYEIGLECIGAADEEEYPDDLRRNWQIVRNQTLASQRKAWAKACGVDI